MIHNKRLSDLNFVLFSCILFLLSISVTGEAQQKKGLQDVNKLRCEYIAEKGPVKYRISVTHKMIFSTLRSVFVFKITAEEANDIKDSSQCMVTVEPISLNISQSVKNEKAKSILKDNDKLLKDYQKDVLKRVINNAKEFSKEIKAIKHSLQMDLNRPFRNKVKFPMRQEEISKKFFSVFLMHFMVEDILNGSKGNVIEAEFAKQFLGHKELKIGEQKDNSRVLHILNFENEESKKDHVSNLQKSLNKRRWSGNIVVNIDSLLLKRAKFQRKLFTGPITFGSNELKEIFKNLTENALNVIEITRLDNR